MYRTLIHLTTALLLIASNAQVLANETNSAPGEHQLKIIQQQLAAKLEERRQLFAEAARINREIQQLRGQMQAQGSLNSGFDTGAEDSAFIGVVLDQQSDDGAIEVIGLTPAGPAQKAGLRNGDFILSLNGLDLLTLPAADRMPALLEKLGSVKAGEMIELTVLRDEQPLNLSLVTGKRQPGMIHAFLGQTVTEYANSDGTTSVSTTGSGEPQPGRQIIIRVGGPDGEAAGLGELDLENHIRILERQLDGMNLDFNIERLLDAEKLRDAEVIIGQAGKPAIFLFDKQMIEGLELVALNPGLGTYFQTDSGVLVLDAEADNRLELRAGDVLIAVNGESVHRPAEVMRKLRSLGAGERAELEIIRHGVSRQLTPPPLEK